MDLVLTTPRLQLTLITRAERGSEELGWLHELRSSREATAWSIHPPSTSIEETEKWMAGFLPPPSSTSSTPSHNIAYAIHSLPSPSDPHPSFIGLVTLTPLSATSLALPPHLTIPTSHEPTTLVVELAYLFLPRAWGKGYATEAVAAVLEACGRKEVWEPWDKVWVRAIVNGRNGKSGKVLGKCGVSERGVVEWRGRIFIGGEWRTEDELRIFGGFLVE